MAKRLPGRYAAIGYVVSKVALPIVKRRAKAKVKSAPASAAKAGARAVKSSPGKASIAIGTAVGAAGFLIAKGRKNGSGAGENSDDT